jgi:hypothetical protein
MRPPRGQPHFKSVVATYLQDVIRQTWRRGVRTAHSARARWRA